MLDLRGGMCGDLGGVEQPEARRAGAAHAGQTAAGDPGQCLKHFADRWLHNQCGWLEVVVQLPQVVCHRRGIGP